MSYHAMGWAARQTGLSPTNKLVLIMLAERADRDTDIAYPSYETLSRDCGLSRRSCITAVQWLEEHGYLSVAARASGGKQTSNRYRLHCGSPTDLATISSGEAVSPARRKGGETAALVKDVHQKKAPSGETVAPPTSERAAPKQVTFEQEDVDVVARGQAKPAHSPESFFAQVLDVVGINSAAIPSARWMPPGAEVEVNRWLDIAPGVLTEDLILRHISESRSRHSEPPNGPKAFERSLRQLAGTLSAPTPTPIAINGRSRRQTDAEQLDDHLDILKARLAVERLG